MGAANGLIAMVLLISLSLTLAQPVFPPFSVRIFNNDSA
jgi:hypothetical protein